MSIVDVTADYSDSSCIVDPTLFATVKGNYVNCRTEELEAEGRTKCCEIEGVKGCCIPDFAWTGLVIIGASIGCITLVCAAGCFYKYYCNDESCPCLVKVREKYDECHPCQRSKSSRVLSRDFDRELGFVKGSHSLRPVIIPKNPKLVVMPPMPKRKAVMPQQQKRAQIWGTKMP